MSIGARKRGSPCGACGLMVEECAISIRNLTVNIIVLVVITSLLIFIIVPSGLIILYQDCTFFSF